MHSQQLLQVAVKVFYVNHLIKIIISNTQQRLHLREWDLKNNDNQGARAAREHQVTLNRGNVLFVLFNWKLYSN